MNDHDQDNFTSAHPSRHAAIKISTRDYAANAVGFAHQLFEQVEVLLFLSPYISRVNFAQFVQTLIALTDFVEKATTLGQKSCRWLLFV